MHNLLLVDLKVRHASIVCYTRHNYDTDEVGPERKKLKESKMKDSPSAFPPNSFESCTPGSARRPDESRATGLDFCRFLHDAYPSLVSRPGTCFSYVGSSLYWVLLSNVFFSHTHRLVRLLDVH